jgi:hypothetical protein
MKNKEMCQSEITQSEPEPFLFITVVKTGQDKPESPHFK